MLENHEPRRCGMVGGCFSSDEVRVTVGRVAGGVEGGELVVVRVASEGELELGFRPEGIEESRGGWERERRRVVILVLLSEQEGVS